MNNSDVKYPNIKVRLTGKNGNAFAIIGNVSRALRTNKVSREEISQFQTEATAGNYDNLLVTCMKWVAVR